MPGRAFQGSPVPSEQAVDKQCAGDGGRRKNREIDPAEGRRRPRQQGIKNEDEHQGEPKVGKRAGEQAVVVGDDAEGPAAVPGAGDAERDANRQGEQQPQGHELQRRRKALR